MSTLINCPSCSKQISIEATACPGCGHPLRSTAPSEALGVAILLIPFGGVALLWLWVGQMNLLQRPADAAMGVMLVVVALTAILIAIEASAMKQGAAKWLIASLLFWVFALPGWLYERSKHGGKNLVVGGVLASLLFGASAWSLLSSIEEKKAEIREKLGRIHFPAGSE